MWCPCACREVGHHTYATPTSYLELINTYTQLLGAQQAAVDQLRKRYEVGWQNSRVVVTPVNGACTRCFVHLWLGEPPAGLYTTNRVLLKLGA